MSCFWRLKIACFTSFKDQFKPGKWKKSLKVKNFEVVNSAISAIFTIRQCKKIGRPALERFSSQKFHFEIFPKTNAFSITFGPRYIHGQSLKEIDFPTRNAVDRFWRDSLKTTKSHCVFLINSYKFLISSLRLTEAHRLVILAPHLWNQLPDAIRQALTWRPYLIDQVFSMWLFSH